MDALRVNADTFLNCFLDFRLEQSNLQPPIDQFRQYAGWKMPCEELARRIKALSGFDLTAHDFRQYKALRLEENDVCVS